MVSRNEGIVEYRSIYNRERETYLDATLEELVELYNLLKDTKNLSYLWWYIGQTNEISPYEDGNGERQSGTRWVIQTCKNATLIPVLK